VVTPDHIVTVVAETDEAEAEIDVMHPTGCLKGFDVDQGPIYRCGIGWEVDCNGTSALLDLCAISQGRDGIYLVGVEQIRLHNWDSAWAEIDTEVTVVELVKAGGTA